MSGKYQWNKNAVSERLYFMPGGLIQMENCQSELVPHRNYHDGSVRQKTCEVFKISQISPVRIIAVGYSFPIPRLSAVKPRENSGDILLISDKKCRIEFRS